MPTFLTYSYSLYFVGILPLSGGVHFGLYPDIHALCSIDQSGLFTDFRSIEDCDWKPEASSKWLPKHVRNG